LPRDAMNKRGLCRSAVSVRLSVAFLYSVETNKHIFKLFSPCVTDRRTGRQTDRQKCDLNSWAFYV